MFWIVFPVTIAANQILPIYSIKIIAFRIKNKLFQKLCKQSQPQTQQKMTDDYG